MSFWSIDLACMLLIYISSSSRCARYPYLHDRNCCCSAFLAFGGLSTSRLWGDMLLISWRGFFFFVKRFGGLVLIDDGCTLYMGLFVGYGRLWVDMDWDWRVDGWIIICFIVDVFDLHSYLVLIFVVLTDLEEEVKLHW